MEHKDKKTTYNVQLYSKKADTLSDLKYLLIDYQDVFEFKIEDRGEMDFQFIIKKKHILRQIEEIDREDIEDKVYCLVTPSHSFTVNNIIVHNCRGYRSEEYPSDGIEIETAQFLSGLIPMERGFLWPIHDEVYGNEEKDRNPNETGHKVSK